MKKAVPYIIIAGILLLVGILVVSGKKMKPARKFDDRITLKESDDAPYGMSAARALLPSLFPGTAVYTESRAPGYWNAINSYRDNQAIVYTARYFGADEYELSELLNFVKVGNHVFITARSFSYEAKKAFGFEYSQGAFQLYPDSDEDSVAVRLEKNAFSSDSVYRFPGKRYESWFSSYDSAHAVVLGRNAEGRPDFIHMKIGAGTVSIHTVPIAFSNYFLLHKNNTEYFEKAFSIIPSRVDKIVWDEYFLKKTSNRSQKPENLLRVLLKYPPFKWGMLLAAVTLLLYLLLSMRRKQRAILAHQKPKNDSLDFVKTMGRLYYERKDHRNLALKMAGYFLEHVRTHYKLPTHNLDKEFEQILHYKSSYPQHEIEDITSFIGFLKNGETVTEAQLAKFHRQLESFYQNT